MARSIKRIALTGGTGFVGRRFIERALARNLAISALARNPAKLAPATLNLIEQNATSDRLRIIQGDLDNREALMSLVQGCDTVVHCAGLTHSLTASEMMKVNVDGSAAIARAAASSGAFFVQISSMAARCPALSDYARSKRDGEDASKAASESGRWLALRPPAIYGPGDVSTLPLFKMVKSGLAPEPATAEPARASILYVDDLVDAILAAVDHAEPGAVYDIDDTQSDGHTWQEIGQTLGRAMGRNVLTFRAPRILMEAQAVIAETAGRLRGKASFVNRGKVAEFFHPDWVAHDNILSANTSWTATTPLLEGFTKTYLWYQEQKLL